MQWGSNWQIATHSGVNPFCLCCCDNKRKGGGGKNSRNERTSSDTARRSADGVNPLLRVRPPKADTAAALAGTSQRELIYATEAFDRQREAINPLADSRWRGVEYRHVRVPVLDTLLLVAFQKLLRNEELEFMLLLLAMELE